MSEQAVLTIDVGSGSCRALLFSPDGRRLGIKQQEWTLPSLPDVPGGLDFDTKQAWEHIRGCIVDVLASSELGAEDVQGVTATSFREGMVLYDGDGEEIWACPNVDKRGRIYNEEMEESGLADRIYDIGGDWLTIISPPRFRWLREHRPEILEQTRRMTMISDWVLYRLCGRYVTEPSVGSSSGIFDLEKRTWSEELVEELELPWDWFPEIVEPGEVVGKFTNGPPKRPA